MNITHSSCVFFCGEPGSGKTNAQKFIALDMWNKGYVKWINVLTESPGDWYYFVPEKDCIITNDAATRKKFQLDEEAEPKEVYTKWLQNLNKECKEIGYPPGIVIIDDVTGVLDFKQNIWKQFFTNRRKYCPVDEGGSDGRMSILASLHYANNLDNTVKNSATDVMMFEMNSDASVNATYSSWGVKRGSKPVFTEYMKNSCDVTKKKGVFYRKNPKGGYHYEPIIFQDVTSPGVREHFTMKPKGEGVS